MMRSWRENCFRRWWRFLLSYARCPIGQLSIRSSGARVCVLELVHQQVTEALIVGVAHVGSRLEELDGFEQQVVEVERLGLAQLPVVKREERGQAFGNGIRRAGVEGFRRQTSILGGDSYHFL